MLEKVFGLKQDFFGLDIGADSLKVMQLKKQGTKISLVSFNEEKIPLNPWAKTGFRESKQIGEIILKSIKKAHPKPITASWVTSALPESLVYTKIIEVPVMKKRDLAKAIFFKLPGALPLEINDIYFDWQVLDEQNGKYNCLLIAASKLLINGYLQVFKDIGLRLIALETKPLANCRALMKKGEKGGLVIVDIGAETTSISLVDQEILRVTGTVPFGGEKLSGQIEKKNLLPLAEEITRLINYYHNRVHQTGRISKIKLCGGGANIPGIALELNKQTDLKTEIGNPCVNIIKTPKELMLPEEALGFTTALGLALREI